MDGECSMTDNDSAGSIEGSEFLIGWAIISFSRRVVLYEISVEWELEPGVLTLKILSKVV